MLDSKFQDHKHFHSERLNIFTIREHGGHPFVIICQTFISFPREDPYIDWPNVFLYVFLVLTMFDYHKFCKNILLNVIDW